MTLGRRVLLPALAGCLLWLGAGAAPAPPAALRPPAGCGLLFEAEASGVQIYLSKPGPGGAPGWVLAMPLARLVTASGGQVIRHYAGPSWEAADGSKVMRDAGVPVVSVPAPDPAADIPWLLVKVAADPAPGLMRGVAYVQRVDTRGGLAPATPPVRAGTEIGVPYTATYLFYGKAG